MENIVHKGMNGVFIPIEDWEKIQFLNKKREHLLAQLVRSVNE